MFDIIFTEQFDKSFSKIRESKSKKQIWKKIQELEKRAPVGKKLKGNPYWSLRVSRFRVIYILEGNQIIVADVLERKYGYREI